MSTITKETQTTRASIRAGLLADRIEDPFTRGHRYPLQGLAACRGAAGCTLRLKTQPGAGRRERNRNPPRLEWRPGLPAKRVGSAGKVLDPGMRGR